MFNFLLVVQAIVTLGLIIVILMQRSEGGGLGMGGGSPSGLMSARGAADFLTRATKALATLFIILSIALAGLATVNRGAGNIDTSLAKSAPAPVTAPATLPAPATGTPGTAAPATAVPIVGAPPANADPLAAAAAKAGAAPKGEQPKQTTGGTIPIQQ